MIRIEAGIDHALPEIIARNPREIGGIQNIRGIARGDHLLITLDPHWPLRVAIKRVPT